MNSAVDICNMALNLVGDAADVVSVDPPEGTPQARMAALAYKFALAAQLESFDWTFACRFAACAPLDTGEQETRTRAYLLPSDCLRVRGVRSAEAPEPYTPSNHVFSYWDGDSNAVDYELGTHEGRRVLFTAAPAPIIRYTTSNVNSDNFSPQFAVALSYKIATLIAGKRVGGKEGVMLTRELAKEEARHLSLARASDVSQRRAPKRHTPVWIGGR